MAKIIGNTTATPNPRSDWAQTDETKADFIKNKPGLTVDENGNINVSDLLKTTDIANTGTLLNALDYVLTDGECNELSRVNSYAKKMGWYFCSEIVAAGTDEDGNELYSVALSLNPEQPKYSEIIVNTTPEAGLDESYESPLEVGDVLIFRNGRDVVNAVTLTSVNHNVIVYRINSSVTDASDKASLRGPVCPIEEGYAMQFNEWACACLDKPNAGVASLIRATFVNGVGCGTAGTGTIVFGRKCYARSDYGIVGGRECEVGYASIGVGRDLSILTEHSAGFGRDLFTNRAFQTVLGQYREEDTKKDNTCVFVVAAGGGKTDKFNAIAVSRAHSRFRNNLVIEDNGKLSITNAGISDVGATINKLVGDVAGAYGKSGSISINSNDWVSGSCTKTIANAGDNDLISIYPASKEDGDILGEYGVFVTPQANGGVVTFSAESTPATTLNLTYFIHRGLA